MIKKSFITFSLTAFTALSFLLSSCGEDDVHLRIEDKKEETKEERVPLDLSDTEISADGWNDGKQAGNGGSDDSKKTRVTESGLFDDGDELWIWAVKRNGNQKGTLLNKGNYADARLHYFKDRKLYPKTPEDKIYLHPNDKIDVYFLYVGNRKDLGLKTKGLQALENVPFVLNNSNRTEFNKNLFLWGKGKDEGYDYQHKKLGSIDFYREVTFMVFSTEKLPNRWLDEIQLTVTHNASTFSPLNGFVSSSSVGGNYNIVKTFLLSETENNRTFGCYLPANCQISTIHYYDNKAGVKKTISRKEPNFTDVDMLKNEKNILRITYVKDVITWEYELSYDNSLLEKVKDLGETRYFLINSRGENRTMTITSLRKELKNGVPTGKVENVPYTITFEGQDANVFRVNGNRIGAIENSTNNRKFGVAVITQDGGAKKRFRVLQEGKVSVIVNT